MKGFEIYKLKSIDFDKFAQVLFFTGVFFLCSSLFLGMLFLIPAYILGGIRKAKNESYFKDKWNLAFFLCGSLMLISSLIQNLFIKNNYGGTWDPSLSLLGLFNWIPFFWFFWAAQPFLDNTKKRKYFALILISGTFPLLITGFGQYFLEWTGPYKAFDGLVVWYLKPRFGGGLTGIFSNQNYAGTWLNFVWPLCIASIFEKNQNSIKKTASITFLISIGTALILTFSRNAWGGLLFALPMVIGQESLTIIIPFLLIGILILIFSTTPLISVEFQSLIQSLVPEKIINELTQNGYESLDVTRLDIYKSAINIIRISPWIGSGAGAFTAIYQLQENFYKGHSHNLFAELSISYGVPVSIIFFTTVFSLLIFSAKSIFFEKSINKKDNFYKKAFWVSMFFFLLSQNVDVQYFEGRIIVISWLFLSLLRNIIKENKNLKQPI